MHHSRNRSPGSLSEVFLQPELVPVSLEDYVCGDHHCYIDAAALFHDVVGILGAFGFWPLTVYFPVEMYIAQKRIPKWSTRRICLQMLSFACLVIYVAAAAGSVAGVILDLKVYKPFKPSNQVYFYTLCG